MNNNTVKISKQELLEIEMFGPHDLLTKIEPCAYCKDNFWKSDLYYTAQSFVCYNCARNHLQINTQTVHNQKFLL